MTILALNSGVNSISNAYVRSIRKALYSDSIFNKHAFLVNRGVMNVVWSYSIKAIILTKQVGHAISLKSQAMQVLYNVNTVLSLAERKLQMITEQHHNISLGKEVDSNLVDEFNKLTDIQNQVILSTKLGHKRILAKAEDDEASNKQFPLLVEGADIKVEMPMLDMSLLYVNSRAVRHAFDNLTFFEKDILQRIADAADAVLGDAAKIQAAINVIIQVMLSVDVPLDPEEQGVKDTITESLDKFWHDELYDIIDDGVVVIDFDSLIAEISDQLLLDLSPYQRTKYNDILHLVRSASDAGEDFNTVKNSVLAILNAIYHTLVAFYNSVEDYEVVHNVSAIAKYSYLVPMLEYIQQDVTIYRLNEEEYSIVDIPLNSPIWIDGAQDGDGDDGAGHFDYHYITVDHIARVLGHSIASFDGVNAVEDNEGRRVGTATSIDSAERVHIAMFAEREVIHQLAQARQKISELVANLEARVLCYDEWQASSADLVAEITKIDPLELQQYLISAQLREVTAAYNIASKFKKRNSLIDILNEGTRVL